MTERLPVIGYEGLYEISSDGDVFRIAPGSGTYIGRKIRPQRHANGYLTFCLYLNGIAKRHLAHRLVATAFIPNPFLFPQINHINGIRHDNQIKNLAWCSQSYNMLHSHYALDNGGGGKKRPIRATHLITGETIDFPSILMAARHVKDQSSNIRKVCAGKYSQVKGWYFSYL